MMADQSVLPGTYTQLGATWDAERGGTHFALYAPDASSVEVCLYDDARGVERRRISLTERTQHVWHGFLPGVGVGQLYGLRVDGPYEPDQGRRFNPAKLLIDPYARAIAGTVAGGPEIFGYPVEAQEKDLGRDGRDSGPSVPKSVVVDPRFDWRGDSPPDVHLADSVIYETHVKGMTAQHPDVPERLRGTYAGLAAEPVIDYLKKLGVTAVELLPVHHHLDEAFLVRRGLVNYWGYNTIGYFAPDARFSSAGDHGEQINEFRETVRTLHAAGLEVILDVVYNHTAEGDHLGPTLGFRGIANPRYYALDEDNPRYYSNVTGTGNSINAGESQTLKLIADSLRYWVQEMHVDGFRFDLAVTLAREPVLGYTERAGFFDVIHQDPVLSRVKLIAEPWDVGDGGYRLGDFPVDWSEWNGKYRDSVRRFWRGDEGQVGELASRLSGSSDLYRPGGRGPTASINFVTAHDGFTLSDLVAHEEKHNQANGENNRDGMDDNIAWNCGVEGPTHDPEVNRLRRRQQRNFLATLFLSQGVPMLLGGDERGRTQKGNNNAYCQDNQLTWYDWALSDEQWQLLDYTRRLIRLRLAHPVLRRRHFFEGAFVPHAKVKDLTWYVSHGEEPSMEEWRDPKIRTLGMRLAGAALDEREATGARVSDETLLVLLNAEDEAVPFTLPAPDEEAAEWEALLDTYPDDGFESDLPFYAPNQPYPLQGRSLALLRAIPRTVQQSRDNL